MTALKIAGEIFEVADRYAEGHTVTATEANVLNAVIRENVRNNRAKHVKENAKQEKPATHNKMQKMIDEYASTYEFGARSVREAVDPVTAIALKLAKVEIRKTLKAADLSKNEDYGKDWINAKAVEVVEAQAFFREEAQRQYDSQQAQANLDLGIN